MTMAMASGSGEPSARELAIEIAGLRQIIDERHQLYEERSQAAKEAVSAALVAQEKLVNAAFAASKEAILKAEESQKGVNERGNEFRQQLKEQNETMIPRTEALAQYTVLGERIDRSFNALSASQKECREDISELREAQRLNEGRALQASVGKTDNRGTIGLLVAIGAVAVALFTAAGGFGKDKPTPAPVIVVPTPAAPTGQAGGSVTDTKSTTKPQ